ncbi:efflux RND transporter periplasmic adaptor subunit [Trinickia dinghuensis]|uniref:Efflux RND transporter periplasmic adaptor subunit n=1 Tax=Trinickia dinghuensis TaxID=2291023 RepID=A0A3D8K5W3_9BURK|nr:efflux RND transporter periplasmic adaptor subunit [Trinickia dinghuensis]RDV00699.1 efflux RND transporter periplasmic adaptor subunit [Trinickia dinghuensis]
MTDKSELLRQLRIERDERPAQTASTRRWWWLAVLLVLLILLAAGAFLTLHKALPAVQSAVATPAATGPGAESDTSILDASGYVVARRQATVSAKITGKLDQLFIEEGVHVKEGDVVAKLDDTNASAALVQAKAGVTQAESTVTQAKEAAADITPIYERDRKLAAAGVISATALDQSKASYDQKQTDVAVAQGNLAVRRAALEVAQRDFDDTIVRAPFTGVVTSKNAQPGEIVSPLSAGGGFTRSGICTLVDMDSLEVEIDVSENFISRVQAGEPATLKLNAYPDWAIPAYVIAVVPTADRSKATVKVRVGFKSRDPRILPEMGARVSFLSPAQKGNGPAHAGGVTLPLGAVQADTDAATGVVYVLHDDTVERREVKLGARGTDTQTVIAGVSPGEHVAVGDLAKLSDGAHVKVVQR